MLTELFQKSTAFGLFETSNLICSYIIKNCRASFDNIKVILLSNFLKIYLVYLNNEKYSQIVSQKCIKNFLKLCYTVSEPSFQMEEEEFNLSDNFYFDVSRLIERCINLPSKSLNEDGTIKYLLVMMEYLLDTNRLKSVKYFINDSIMNWLFSLKFNQLTYYSLVIRLFKKIIFYFDGMKKNPFVKYFIKYIELFYKGKIL